MALRFLLCVWRRNGNDDALEIARGTFLAMARGGIYDQLGGGLARYSVDERWLVPHFEKMLYDNALFIQLGADLFRATRDDEVRAVTSQTIGWLERDMLAGHGAFHSSWDADSDGEEGRYYVWSESEFDALPPPLAQTAKAYYGVTAGGNFEGHNILYRARGDEPAAAALGITVPELRSRIEAARSLLLDKRSTRVPPGRDDKIVASWNALACRALISAGEAFGSESHARMGMRCAEFLFANLVHDVDAGGRTLPRVARTLPHNGSRIAGVLEDHAALGLAAVAAYQHDFNAAWLQRACALAESCLHFFWSDGVFHDTASDAEHLVTRPRDVTDNAVPSGTSLAVELLLLLAEYHDVAHFRDAASRVLSALNAQLTRYPTAFGHMLCNADMLVHGGLQLALIAPSGAGAADFAKLRAPADSAFIPARVMAASPGSDGDSQLTKGKRPVHGRPTAYLCRRYVCDAPTTEATVLGQQIADAFAASHPANGISRS
jgi:uncharacterized protein YyaL (SSP411 family)